MQRTPVGEVDAAEAFKLLCSRWSLRRSVREAFLSIDKDCDGVISPAELRASVDGLGVRLSGAEFRKLWRTLDSAGEGRLTHAAFNRVLGPLLYPSGWGLSATMNRPVTPPLSPTGEALLGQALRRKVSDLEGMWAELDLYGSGAIRHSEFIQGLRMLGIRVSDATVFALMKRFADPSNSSGDLSRAEFMACMHYLLQQVPEPVGARDEEAHAALLAEAEKEVARVLPYASKARLAGALAPFDMAGTGALSYSQFQGMLEELGVRGLRQAHYAALCEKYDDGVGEGQGIDLTNFVGVFWGAHGGVGGDLGGAAGTGGEHASELTGGVHAGMSGDYAEADAAGGLGLGGPHAAALIRRNMGEGAALPSLMSSRRGYPPWAAVGVRPLVDPLTQQPTTMDKLARLAMPRTGLSEGESRAVLCMVGRREAITAALAAADPGSTGAVSKAVFRDTLAQQFEVAVDASSLDLLAYRYDPAHTGKRVFYREFFASMGRLLDAPYHPTSSALALAHIGLEAIPGVTLARRAAGSSSSSSSQALSPLQLAMAASPLAGISGSGSSSSSLPPPDPFSPHWRERGSSRHGGEGGGAAAAALAASSAPLASPPRVVQHSDSASTSPTSTLLSGAAGSAVDEATESLLARLRAALGRKWGTVAQNCASHLEAALSPLAQAGRAGVSADLGQPLPKLNLGSASAAAAAAASPGRRLAGGVATSALDSTLRLGAAARAGGSGSAGGGSGGRGSPAAASGALGRSTLPLRRVPLSLLQRVLTQQGLGVTPRELRLLSERYGNGSAGAQGSEPLHVDLEALIRDNQ